MPSANARYDSMPVRCGHTGSRLAALLIGYWAVVNAAWECCWFGAPGLRFFQYLVTLNGCLIGLAGIGFFSSAITEEKEEGTLGLMQMTGISPLGILFGKLVSRLLQASLLIIIQIPFTLLAITLGGITLPQILATYSTLLCSCFWSRTSPCSLRLSLPRSGPQAC